MNQVARADNIQEVLRIVRVERVFHGIQVIQIAEEFIEAVDGGQEFILVTKMVLAELAGRIALRFQHGGDRDGFRRDADRRAGLADRGHAGADGQFTHDEVRATRRAARLGVIVGEQHAFLGQLVEVRRLAGHHVMAIGADVRYPDVIAHDDQNVGFLILRGSARSNCQPRDGSTDRQSEAQVLTTLRIHQLPPIFL